jgi:hypothetical protein
MMAKTKLENPIKKIKEDNKWLDLSRSDILSTLNSDNQREWKVTGIYDDGVRLKVWNKKYFISNDCIDQNQLSTLSVWEMGVFIIEDLDTDKINKNKIKIEKLKHWKLKDGIHEWVISGYESVKNKTMKYTWYNVMLGEFEGEQEVFFIERKDMKIEKTVSVWDVISLDIKETEKGFMVKEVYFKKWSEFTITPHNYKINKDWDLWIHVWHYNGIVYQNKLPDSFKKGDGLNVKVKFIKNSVRKKWQEKDIDRKFIWFEEMTDFNLVKAESKIKLNKSAKKDLNSITA